MRTPGSAKSAHLGHHSSLHRDEPRPDQGGSSAGDTPQAARSIHVERSVINAESVNDLGTRWGNLILSLTRDQRNSYRLAPSPRSPTEIVEHVPQLDTDRIVSGTGQVDPEVIHETIREGHLCRQS
jgi:hypothetical protein